VNIIDVAPNEAITSVTADWSLYYQYAVECLANGKDIDADWVAGYEENAVCLSQFNDAHLPENTIEKVADAEKDLRKGKAKVFDLDNFTVEGENFKELTKNNKDYSKFKSYVSKGEFKESRKKSVPVMDFLIDGIKVVEGDYLSDEDE
jgi:basic membrane protein A